MNREWIDYWRSKSTINPDGTIAAADVEAIFNQFSADGRLLPHYNWFDRTFYWQPGMYSLRMRIASLGAKREHVNIWRFALTESDVENLRANNYKILRAVCNLTNLPWTYALAKYEQQ